MPLTIKTLPKTLSIASLFLSLSSPLAVMAGGYEAPAPMPVAAQDTSSHFYLGLQLGMGLLDGQYKARASATLSDDDVTTTDVVYQRWHNAFGGSSVLVGAVFGVDTVFSNDVYGALEINTTYDSYGRTILSYNAPAETIGEDTFGPFGFRTRLKNSFLYGLTAKLGKDMGGYTPYIVGGVEAGRWRATVHAEGGTAVEDIFPVLFTNPNEDSSNPTQRVRFSKTRAAPTAGVGVRFKIVDNWQGDLQYRYSWFGNIHHRQEFTATGDDVSVTAQVKTRITPNQGKALFSLNYYFDTV